MPLRRYRRRRGGRDEVEQRDGRLDRVAPRRHGQRRRHDLQRWHTHGAAADACVASVARDVRQLGLLGRGVDAMGYRAGTPDIWGLRQ